MSDAGESDGVCPFEKTCPLGCPCPFFECESVDTREITFGWYYNETDALFELERNTPTIGGSTKEDHEYVPVEPNYHHLSRLASFEMKNMKRSKVYEQFILYIFGVHSPLVSSLINEPKSFIISSKGFL